MGKREGYNQKAWYRLLKVLFVSTFFIVYGFLVLFLAYDAKWRELDLKNTAITCKSANEPTVKFYADELDFDLQEDDFVEGVFQYEEYFKGSLDEYDYDGSASNLKQILNKCWPTQTPATNMAMVLTMQRMKELKAEGYSKDAGLLELKNETIGITENSEFFEKLTFDSQLFNIKPNYNYFTFIPPLFIAFLGCFFVWELVRRIFYYVAFGSMLFGDYTVTYRKLRALVRKLLMAINAVK